MHFTGKAKPWLGKGGALTFPVSLAEAIDGRDTKKYWFAMLQEVDKELNMGLNFTIFLEANILTKKPALGHFPKYGDALNKVHLTVPVEA
jgi:hypothetical protein